MCTKLNEFNDSTKLYHENIRKKLYTSILNLHWIFNLSEMNHGLYCVYLAIEFGLLFMILCRV